jgi:predicted  nucleic acid-binding Zn-ribbon protein
MRRAITAENELDEARKKLAEMEQRAKDLGWQVNSLRIRLQKSRPRKT